MGNHEAGQAIKHAINRANDEKAAAAKHTPASVSAKWNGLQQSINSHNNQMANSMGNSFSVQGGMWVDESSTMGEPQITHPTEGLGRYVSHTRLVWDKLHNKLLSKMWHKLLHTHQTIYGNNGGGGGGMAAGAAGASGINGQMYYATSTGVAHYSAGANTASNPQYPTGINPIGQAIGTSPTGSLQYQAMQAQMNNAAAQQRADADAKLQGNMAKLKALFYQGGGSSS